MNSTVMTRSEIEKQYFNTDSLNELIGALEKEAESKGEVICQVLINDMALTEGDEQRLAAIPLSDIHKLEIRSERPAQLLFDILLNWEQELPKMIAKSDELATRLRNEGREAVYTPFVQLVDSCQFLIESLMSLDAVVETGRYLSPEVWTASEKVMAESVGQTLDAFEQNNDAILADVIEYDLANALQSWFDLLKGFRATLTAEYENNHGELINHIFKKSAKSQADSVDHQEG